MDADTQEGVANNSPERVSLETNNKNRRKRQKIAWSHSENGLEWQCYVRSKKIRGKGLRSGYMTCMKEIWDGRDVGVRTMNGLVKKASSIRKGKFLSELKKKEIEDQVNGREREVIGNGEEDEEEDEEGGNIEEEVHVEEIEFTVAKRCKETENRRVNDIRIMDRGRGNTARVDTVKEDAKVRILDENEKRSLGKVKEAKEVRNKMKVLLHLRLLIRERQGQSRRW